MKFLVIGDLHGIKPKIKIKDFDYIIAPGDFCSDRDRRKLYIKWFKYMKEFNDCCEEPLDSNEYFIKILKITPSKLKKYDEKSLQDGRKVLEFLNSFGKPVFIVPGNWDQSDAKYTNDDSTPLRKYKNLHERYSGKRTNSKLTRGLKNIFDCQFKVFKFKEFNILGYGLSSGPELPDSREVDNKDQIRKIKVSYNKLFDKVKSPYFKRNKSNPTIFLSHNVPQNTKLDKIISPESYLHGKHFGSRITKDFIKKYQPLICIGGHMHEHFRKDKIGKTICINSGFGHDVNVIFEIKNNKIINLKFLGQNGV